MPRKRKTIDMKPSRHWWNDQHRDPGPIKSACWVESLPFANNPRGVLSHRVAHVTTLIKDGVDSHWHIDYLCCNGCNVSPKRGFSIHDVLCEEPGDRLLCERCEMMARIAKLPDADVIVGRHVHRGVLVPQQTCCGGKK